MGRVPSFEKSFASHPKSKFWSNKNDIYPRDVFISSNKKFWFNCDKCEHSFDTALNHVTHGNKWCPFCANKKLCNSTECKICFEKSFASHPKSKFWSNKNDIQPRDVLISSHKKFWFNCDKCEHSFDCNPANITHGNKWCPFCANNKLCNSTECKICFEKSFASHPKSKFWSNKNDIQPTDVFKCSRKKFWFNCDKCEHSFDTKLECVSCSNSWCPFCANNKLCNSTECKICFEKSFASHPKSKFWSNKNDIQPTDVFIFSNKRFWFNCDKCEHSFDTALNLVTYSNSWCPFCVNKTETLVFETLRDNGYNTGEKTNINMFEGRKRYDIVLKDKKIIIEVDGPQHFKDISNWKSYEETYKNDLYKEEIAHNNGYRVIRISQEYVWNRQFKNGKTEWFDHLVKSINYETERQFISDEDEYLRRYIIT